MYKRATHHSYLLHRSPWALSIWCQRLSIATLFYYLKRDVSPAEYAAFLVWRRTIMAATPSATTAPAPSYQSSSFVEPTVLQSVKRDQVLYDIKSLGNGMERLDIGQATIGLCNDGIKVSSGEVDCIVKPDLSVKTARVPFVGSLLRDKPVNANISVLSTALKAETYRVTRESPIKTVLVACDPPHSSGMSVVVHNPDDAALCFACVCVPGSNDLTVKSKQKIRFVRSLLDAKQAELARELYGITPAMFNVVGNHNTVNIYNGNPVSQEEGFKAISAAICQDAAARRLRKADGIVYEPLPGCPCAYRKLATYEKYVNLLLRHNPIFNAHPARLDEALKYLHGYVCIKEFPQLEVDRDLLSFANGVLRLSDASFVPYADIMGPRHEDDVEEGNDIVTLATKVARNHIDAVYNVVDGGVEEGGETGTPLFDTVLGRQFQDDAAVTEMFCALLGRLLFRVGDKDNWQVMPYLQGVAGSGKSLVLSIMETLVGRHNVGTLGAKREEIFGTASIFDKDVVIGREMPHKLSNALPQELMQSMVCGETIEVPRKLTRSINVQWTAPVILASNYAPDYVNTANNVGRRLVVFRFENPVSDPQEDLLDRIKAAELPAIAARIVRAYLAAVQRVKQTRGGFWKTVPPQLLVWRGDLAAGSVRLRQFLSMNDTDRGCTIEHVDGRVTWMTDFKVAFRKTTGEALASVDAAVFADFGFRVSDNMINVCKHCGQVAASRGNKCCDAYDHASGRAKKIVIYNMKLLQAVE